MQPTQPRWSTTGAIVDVLVDMNQRLLSFAVNDGPPVVAAGMKLPAAVRPWVLMNWQDDTVTLDVQKVSK